MSLTLQTLALYSLLAGTPKTAAEQQRHDARAEFAGKKDAGVGMTPLDQSDSDADVKLTQNIRQAVMDDDRLSFTSKNVKIISRGGEVTLRGEVPTKNERDVIRMLASKVAGVSKVNDQLELPPAAQKPVNSN